MNIETIVVLVLGVGVGAWNAYLYFKLRELEQSIYSYPTIEEIAKEVIKIKIPISELPPELQEQMMSGMTTKPQGKNPLVG